MTEATLKLVPRLPHVATLLAPFGTLDEVTASVPVLLSSGLSPLILEYIDALAMAGITRAAGLDLGIPADVQAVSVAYLVVMLESAHGDRLEEDVGTTAQLLTKGGAHDVYVLPPGAGSELITARERAFFVSKAAGANDIIDTVVPRAAIPAFMPRGGRARGRARGPSVGLRSRRRRQRASRGLPARPSKTATPSYERCSARPSRSAVRFRANTDWELRNEPTSSSSRTRCELTLMRRIKAAFDPNGILGPGRGVADTAPG